MDRYGKGKRFQVDSFISDLISDKFFQNIDNKEKGKKKEGLSLIFGLNKGYKAFRNKYTTSNFEVDVKFHLDSKLDYYVIESIYQNIFNSLNSISSFTYIDNLIFEAKKQVVKTSNYATYQMIDETIIWKPIGPFASRKSSFKNCAKNQHLVSKFCPSKKNEIEALFKADGY